MQEFTLDPKLKVVAEVAKDLGCTQRRIQQLIANGDLEARKATDFEAFALRQAGRIRSSTARGVWLIQQMAVDHLLQLRTDAFTQTTHSTVGYPKYRPRSKQRKIPSADEPTGGILKHKPLWNVPSTFTSLIGREQDVTMIGALLLRPDIRLLTLLGVGGIGKTRLSLQVAREMRQHFSDGVCFVSLAAIHDPELVVPAIAQELGIPEIGTQSLFEQVQASLHDKQLLLILDNFEQVVSASAQIEELSASCLSLKIMVTSRAVLHLQAEQEFTVPPLALPNLNHLPAYEVLSDYAAVALFVRRAQAIWPAFHITADNARPIAEICVRLDGLPLAIELAAARIKLLPPQALLARLTQRFQVLTSGIRTLPERQQTLRNTLRWSYDLLAPEEQRLFRRLSVFVGGWSLEAVDAVVYAEAEASSGPASVLDGVASLLDNSLLLQVKQEGNEPRLIMLETVREYGLECLRESGEAEVSRHAHALYYLRLAEQAESHLRGAQQLEWLDQLEMEQENFRAALEWLLEHKVDLAVRLGGAMWWFWYVRGYWSEGRRWLEAALASPSNAEHTAARAKALRGAGTLAMYIYPRDFTAGHALLEESVTLYRQLGDTRGLAGSLGNLGWSKYWQNDHAVARTLLQECIGLAREISDTGVLAYGLRYLSEIFTMQSNFEQAFPLVEESVALCRELGDTHGLVLTLTALSRIVLYQGNLTQAAACARESLTLAHDLHNKPDIIQALYALANVAEYQSDYEQAGVLRRESLALARELGSKNYIADALYDLGAYALYRGDFFQANAYLEECLSLTRAIGFMHTIALTLYLLGEVKRVRGEVVQATALFTEGLTLAREVGSKYTIGCSLIGLAKVAVAEGQFERAGRLFGASVSWLNPAVDSELEPWPREDYHRAIENLHAHLGEEAYKAAWGRGLTMTPEEALTASEAGTSLEQVSVKPPSPTAKSGPSPTYPDELTAREVDVLRLVAQGWTDAQIAGRLVISARTVNAHVTSIYRKIGVSSRSGATRYAIEKKLLLPSDT